METTSPANAGPSRHRAGRFRVALDTEPRCALGRRRRAHGPPGAGEEPPSIPRRGPAFCRDDPPSREGGGRGRARRAIGRQPRARPPRHVTAPSGCALGGLSAPPVGPLSPRPGSRPAAPPPPGSGDGRGRRRAGKGPPVPAPQPPASPRRGGRAAGPLRPGREVRGAEGTRAGGGGDGAGLPAVRAPLSAASWPVPQPCREEAQPRGRRGLAVRVGTRWAFSPGSAGAEAG